MLGQGKRRSAGATTAGAAAATTPEPSRPSDLLPSQLRLRNAALPPPPPPQQQQQQRHAPGVRHAAGVAGAPTAAEEELGAEEQALAARAEALRRDLGQLEQRKLLLQLREYKDRLAAEADARFEAQERALREQLATRLRAVAREKAARDEALASCSAGISRKIEQLQQLKDSLQQKVRCAKLLCHAVTLDLRVDTFLLTPF